MAKVLLNKDEVATKDENIIRVPSSHLEFNREGGTHDVIIQKKAVGVEDATWRNQARIEASNDDEQGLSVFASGGFDYRAIVDANSNTDTWVTYGESSEPRRMSNKGP